MMKGIFLILEVFQLINEEGMGGLEYLILKLLTKNNASLDNNNNKILCKGQISLGTKPHLTAHCCLLGSLQNDRLCF